MNKAFIFALLSLALASPVAHAQPSAAPATAPPTVVKSAAAHKKLLGRHMLSLQWILGERYGSATVRDRNGLLTISGRAMRSDRQGGEAGKDDFVSLDGVITEVDEKEFVFDGTILTKVYFIAKGAECERTGKMRFAITQNRKYWRLQEPHMQNPCDLGVDYIDIYFR